MNRVMIPVLVACAAACGSSSGGSAEVPGDGGGTSNVLKCGHGSLVGSARGTDANDLGPIAGATVSAPGCTTAVTDGRGYVVVQTDPGFLMKLDVTASGYVHEHAEVSLPTGATNGFALTGSAYPESAKTTLFQGWDDSKGYLLVFAEALADGGTCGSPEGISLSVKGHPELTPIYMKDLNTPDPALTSTAAATTTVGGAVFGPMAPGDYEIEGTKAGCQVSPLSSAEWVFNASVGVEAGAVTLHLLQMD